MTAVPARLRLAALVALAVVAADQATKALVDRHFALGETVELTSFAALTYVRNTGAAFGMFAGTGAGLRLPLFLLVSVVAVGVLGWFLGAIGDDQRAVAAGIGAILGGVVGNAICRLRFGAVIDFIDVHWRDLHWPAFNVADSAITVGAALVILLSGRDGPRA
ncbi:MAG TPA: signal peptidase II [Candidatus Binatia bacterium]|nr:signal peptidase II [Candidatus Binatia bacterium]